MQHLDLAASARLPAPEVLHVLGSGEGGLSAEEARRRLGAVGPNALRSHRARPLTVLGRQLRNPLLLLLLAAALTSAFVGERTDALIIFLISGLSVGLGFFNEYRSERAVEALHSRLRHTALALRDGARVAVDATELVPGAVVRVGVGDVVPADLRMLAADELECDEAVLTGESLPAGKQSEPVGATESHRRPLRHERRRRRPDRRRDRVRRDRAPPRRAAAADGFPARAARLLASARARHRRARGDDPRRQCRARPVPPRGRCCSRSRSRSA